MLFACVLCAFHDFQSDGLTCSLDFRLTLLCGMASKESCLIINRLKAKSQQETLALDLSDSISQN